MFSAVPSALWMAHIFGACSPTVMWSMVMTANARMSATGCTQALVATSKPAAEAALINSVATAGSASQPRIRLASVMPSWQAERYRSRCRSMAETVLARRFPPEAKDSIRPVRTFTKANSAATKNPLRRTNTIVAKRSHPMGTL